MVEYACATGSCDPCPTEPPSNEELEQAGYAGDRWDSYFTRLRVRYTPEAATQDIMLYTAGYMDNEQIRYILYNEDMEDRHPVCGIGMVDDPGTCDDESGSDSGGGSTGGGGSGGGSTGDDGGAGDGGAGDGSGSEEGSEWEQSGIEVTELGDLDSSSKSGCSHTGHRSTGLGWTLILGMMALFGRRRQSAG
jgi:hypothetical protein